MLAERGVRTVQFFGVPSPEMVASVQGKCQAIVACLKSRSIDPREAQDLSLQALDALRVLAPKQWQFKYCSTFDSTAQGNIGPVTEVLLDRLEQRFTVAVPALPINGRTQYLGYLFVGRELLSESPMRHHPLNPMTDSNLVRHLQLQTKRPVGLVDLTAVRSGHLAESLDASAQSVSIALVDALDDSDLARIADATADFPLITGGSGLAMHLPAVWRERGWLQQKAGEPVRSSAAAAPVKRGALILSGSCSAATLRQLDSLRNAGCQILPLNLDDLDNTAAQAARVIEQEGWAAISSSAAADQRYPHQYAGRIEQAFGKLAEKLVTGHGIRQLIVAGGETSGAVVGALGVKAVEITGTIDPGVPSLRTLDDRDLALALKSGNFGSTDFFEKTLRSWKTL